VLRRAAALALVTVLIGACLPSAPRPLFSVRHPAPTAFRVDAAGLPVVSAAGLVQVVEDGPELYDAFRLPGFRDWAATSGRLDTVNWCEIEALCAVQRVAHAWRERHPDAPRLGIAEVTAKEGGFPDFSGKGVSEHLTHQVGVNVNLLYMGRERPEKEIIFGMRNESLYAPRLQRELVELLFDHGANAVTMTAHARITDRIERAPDLAPGVWRLEKESPDGERIWQAEGRRTLILRKEPWDHGDHANVHFSFLW
jgi:hypothetical protein